MFSRDQLEIVIKQKKLDEVLSWFREHFITIDHHEYINRKPIVILQGPTGCGKSSVLRWISGELGIPIKEFNESTDLTAIKFDLSDRRGKRGFDEQDQTSSIRRNKSENFEQFIVNNVRFNTFSLHNTEQSDVVSTGEPRGSQTARISSQTLRESRTPNGYSENRIAKPNGIIIHIETPLTFARTQHQMIQTLGRLLKILKELSRRSRRRVAIVFETIEGHEMENLMLSGRVRNEFGIKIFKFNKIVATNMKKLVELFICHLDSEFYLDKETLDQLIDDSDGDMSACLSTLRLLCNSANPKVDGSISDKLYRVSLGDMDASMSKSQQVAIQARKRQKLNHNKGAKKVILTSNLMRDTTRSVAFFHVLGKIFYQKRLYPLTMTRNLALHGNLERPFPTQNTTEHLLSLIDVEAGRLIEWFHHHYTTFCDSNNLKKADLLLENLSEVDIISLTSVQCNQFYEHHYLIDQLQSYVAIEATVFSLYENQSQKLNGNKKIPTTSDGRHKILNSVEINSSLQNLPIPTTTTTTSNTFNNNYNNSNNRNSNQLSQKGWNSNPVNQGCWNQPSHRSINHHQESSSSSSSGFFSFKKPTIMALPNLISEYRRLADMCQNELDNKRIGLFHKVDTRKLVTDYLPYMDQLADSWHKLSLTDKHSHFGPYPNGKHPIMDDSNLVDRLCSLVKFDQVGLWSSDDVDKQLATLKPNVEEQAVDQDDPFDDTFDDF